jgi:hypothetical protein
MEHQEQQLIVEYDDLACLTAIELPCFMREDGSIIEALSYHRDVIQDLNSDAQTLQFRFPSEDIFRHSIQSSVSSRCNGLLVRVRRKKPRSGVSAAEVSQQPHVEVIGKVTKVYEFKNPADYVVCNTVNE